MKLFIMLLSSVGLLSFSFAADKRPKLKLPTDKQREVASVGEVPDCTKNFKENEYYGYHAYIYLKPSWAQDIKVAATADDIVNYLHLLDENHLDGKYVTPQTMSDLGSMNNDKDFVIISALIGKPPKSKGEKAKFFENVKKLAQVKNVRISCAVESIE